ncbi:MULTISPECIES: GNAT family N-acetyltransferase [unclassified Lacticaseibacillus]|uniref:GNAT family N-acetyltransferase n=1 Tax=unclassified Lacticaseibacillus TaxID=2759744 RepID=UPI00194121E7|nr:MULTISPECIES: GNAT family N-acetyltransferase [unclassified Lacticaseibacillus]
MEFKVSTDTNSSVYQDALAIRTTVFVKEQHVSPEREVDQDEAKATYFVAYDDGLAVATARLLPADYGFHVQRVAVLAPYRHHGVGKVLLEHLADYAEAHGAHELRLGAQVQAVGFYKALGYTLTEKPEFLDAGIRHREMHRIFA